jgi:tight adherence protein B
MPREYDAIVIGGGHNGLVNAAYLAKAGLPMSPLKYALILVGIGLALYLVATRFLQIGSLGGVSLALFGIPFITQAYLRSRRQQFLKQLQVQLPEAAMMISNALKAGHSLAQALTFVTDHARQPARDIFRQCRQEIELGRPLEEILKDLVTRYDSPDLRLMLAAMLVQKQTGGNLIAALDGIARTIRKRQETLGEVQAMLAQAQQTVRVMPFLPLLCGIMFNVALPGFLLPLFTIPGLIVIAVLIPLQLGAAYVIKRMTHIEV